MLLGLILLVASWGTNLEGWVIMYAWALFIYGKSSLKIGHLLNSSTNAL